MVTHSGIQFDKGLEDEVKKLKSGQIKYVLIKFNKDVNPDALVVDAVGPKSTTPLIPYEREGFPGAEVDGDFDEVVGKLKKGEIRWLAYNYDYRASKSEGYRTRTVVLAWIDDDLGAVKKMKAGSTSVYVQESIGGDAVHVPELDDLREKVHGKLRLFGMK